MLAPIDRLTSKVFVLDTNVILHDASCLRNFEENDIAIPIAVLEELDCFKKGNEDIHFQARSFLRQIDQLTGDMISEKGVSLGSGLGCVRILMHADLSRDVSGAFVQDCPDHRILNAALHLAEQERPRQVIMVTKDTNLRMKAKAFGLTAQDYSTDKVESFDKLYTGKRLVKADDEELFTCFQDLNSVTPADLLPSIDSPICNENFILRSGSRSILVTYDGEQRSFRRMEKQSASGISPRNAEQIFALNALLNHRIPLVTLVGKAGSGKTLLALAAALESRTQYQQILIARPTVPLSNRDLGFLPGDLQAKLDPYMQPLFDNLALIRSRGEPSRKETRSEAESIQKGSEFLHSHKIEVSPLAYIRGRSLHRTYFIIDEAQNLTPHEIKTIITRAGEGTKIVFTGDIHQIDHPYLDTLSNGLSYVIDRLRGQPLYAHVSLEKGERSELSELASVLL